MLEDPPRGQRAKNGYELLREALDVEEGEMNAKGLRKAYKELVKQYHPDKYKARNEEDARMNRARFVEITAAFQALRRRMEGSTVPEEMQAPPEPSSNTGAAPTEATEEEGEKADNRHNLIEDMRPPREREPEDDMKEGEMKLIEDMREDPPKAITYRGDPLRLTYQPRTIKKGYHYIHDPEHGTKHGHGGHWFWGIVGTIGHYLVQMWKGAAKMGGNFFSRGEKKSGHDDHGGGGGGGHH